MEYKISRYLSSYEFYKELGNLDTIIQIYHPEKITLDFSDVVHIDALAIPNIIFMGRYLKEKTGYIPYIRLGENLNSGYIKKFLRGINFYEISNEFYYYENDKYSGLSGKNMDPRNTTEYFPRKDGEEVARKRIYYRLCPFLYKYLREFDTHIYNNTFYNIHIFENNTISKFIEEMIINSFEHGESDAIVTVQSNYKKKKIYLAISDYGKGFWKSVTNEWDSDDDNCYNVLKREPKTELDGILMGIYKRKFSKYYGLYNVIKQVFELGGTLRIHSNRVQLILTKRLKDSFYGEKIDEFSRNSSYNIVKTSLFKGTHIEIEIPLKFLD